MKINQKIYHSIFVFVTIVFIGASISAQEIQIERADNPIPFLSLETGKEDPQIEASAIEPIDDGSGGNYFLVANDEDASLLVVDAKTGAVKKKLSLEGVTKKPKWEALARDEEGYYYALGSHSVKVGETDAAKLKNRSRLFRFRLKTDGSDLSNWKIEQITEWDISEALKSEGYSSDPTKNKVKVEGLAIRTELSNDKKVIKRDLVIGLREPDNPVQVLVSDITELPSTGSKLKLQRFFNFNAGTSEGVNLRLSSIEYIPNLKGFLILTSTEDNENKFHGNALWFMSDEKIAESQMATELAKPVEPKKLWIMGIANKAEGICIIPGVENTERTIRLAVVYDNDGLKSSLLQTITLALWKK